MGTYKKAGAGLLIRLRNRLPTEVVDVLSLKVFEVTLFGNLSTLA